MTLDPREEFDQTGLIRSVAFGILGAVIGVAALTVVIMRLGAPGRGWGDALLVASFVGPWAGVFFGSVAAVGAFEARRQRTENRAHELNPPAQTDERLAA